MKEIRDSVDNLANTLALFPGSPQVLNVARRERREPGKLYHVHDVGIEATWSAARTNHDMT